MSSPLAVLRRLRPPADADPLTGYARTRDPLLFAELVRRHGGLVWGVCRRALPHRPDAEDAYQATWLVLAANPAAVRTPAALPGFLHTVAVRTSRRVRQKRPITVDAHAVPARESADRAALAALDAELARLPESLRLPLVRCFLDGQTQDEAARELGLSLSTLKRRLDTGKDLLRVRLAGRDVAAVLATTALTGVGAPAVVAGGAGVAATALSTEVLSAMWMLKAKTWAAGLVVAAGLTATGGGLILAGGQGPAKTGSPAAAAVPEGPAALPPATLTVNNPPAAQTPAVSDAVRAAYSDQVRELERAVIAAEEAVAAQQKVAERYRVLPGVSETELLNNIALVARYREHAIQCRVELAKVKVEIARLGPAPAATVTVSAPTPAVPARLLKERRRTAEQFLELDKQIRDIGAISKEEAATFEMNASRAAQEMYEATCAEFPTPAYRLAAAQEWYIIARDIEQFYRARAERGLNREQVALAALSGRCRAEVALFQAASVAPPSEVAKLDPRNGAQAGFAAAVAKVTDDWVAVKPADGLRPRQLLRVSRAGKPVGTVVVILPAKLDGPPEAQKRIAPALSGEVDTALVIRLPNPDGILPQVQVGDDVRP